MARTLPTNGKGRKRPQATASGLADWFAAHAVVRKQGPLQAKPQYATDFVNFLWPVGLEYCSPLNPFFLIECQDPAQLKEHRTWMARDGMLSLLWFFKANPQPRGFDGEILVPLEFAEYVPVAWKSRVGFFELVSLPDPAARLPKRARPVASGASPASAASKKILLTGLVMDTYCSIDHLESLLEQLESDLGDLSAVEAQCFLLGRFDGWGTEHQHDFHPAYFTRIAKAFGSIDAMTWLRFESVTDWSGWTVVDLNEKLLCSDSYLVHQALARGAELWAPRLESPVKPGASAREEFIRLSPYHGVRVWHVPSLAKAKPMSLEAERRFQRAMASESNRRFPWPGWFTNWALVSRPGRRPGQAGANSGLMASKFSNASRV